MNLVYFRKGKEKQITTALEWLPTVQEGCILVFAENYTQYTSKYSTVLCELIFTFSFLS